MRRQLGSLDAIGKATKRDSRMFNYNIPCKSNCKQIYGLGDDDLHLLVFVAQRNVFGPTVFFVADGYCLSSLKGADG